METMGGNLINPDSHEEIKGNQRFVKDFEKTLMNIQQNN